MLRYGVSPLGALFVHFQKFQGALNIAKEAQQGEYQQCEYRQGNKLGHPGDHKGQITAEEHIVAGEAQQPVDAFAVDHMDQAT